MGILTGIVLFLYGFLDIVCLSIYRVLVNFVIDLLILDKILVSTTFGNQSMVNLIIPSCLLYCIVTIHS